MERQKNKYFWFLTNNKGFTLIEMAIVLIIIGIIIGAVIKGKDIIRSAEQKKIYTKYTNAWRLCYLNFYDRTGKRLGDFYDAAVPTPGQDSKCDTHIAGTAPDDTNRGYLKTGDATANFYGLDDIGLTAPTTNTSNCWEYTYTDVDGTGHDLAIAFKYDTVGKYNYIWITEIPGELGLAMDTMIDGEANGTAGDFLSFVADDSGSALAWGSPTAEVSARWKMDF